MIRWNNLPDPGKCWHFVYLTGDAQNEPLQKTVEALAALWPVVQPLSMTLEMAARSVELPYIETGVEVPFSTWHLREAKLPPGMEVAATMRGPGHQEELAPILGMKEIGRWLATAHSQKLEEGYLPVLYALELPYTRARIAAHDDETTAQVTYGPEVYHVPIEVRLDGVWVAGPPKDSPINPPIRVSLENNDGRLTLSICVGWSPWVEPGSPEAELFSGCIDRLRSQGWEPHS